MKHIKRKERKHHQKRKSETLESKTSYLVRESKEGVHGQ